MKDKNKFVLASDYDLEEEVLDYNQMKNALEESLQLKAKYEDMLEENNNDSKELSFKEQIMLLKIIRTYHWNNENYDELLDNLLYKLDNMYPDVYKYNRIDQAIKHQRECISDILRDHIRFDYFRKDEFVERCECCGHTLVNFDDELKCLFCNATTKDYGLTKEEVDFLTLCAEKQGLLYKEIKKEDLPFVQLLLNKSEEIRDERNKRFMEEYRNTDEELRMDLDEELFYDNEYETWDIKNSVKEAHLLDEKKYDDIDTFYDRFESILDEEEKQKILNSIEEELEKIKTGNSKFKDLMIEECNTAKYEVLILSGGHLPTLAEEVKTEEDLIALTKAYYNLSNEQFRMNSDYFKEFYENYGDAFRFYCLTANPKINNKILEMKVRR